MLIAISLFEMNCKGFPGTLECFPASFQKLVVLIIG
jgi:hypothetical protein